MKAHLVQANGVGIPAIGLGTWKLKGQECTEAVRRALEIGYRHIDTAAIYENEEAVGKGIRLSGVPREEIFVTTKIWFPEAAENRLIHAAEASLQRLDLSNVNLLLLHWPSPEFPLNGTIKALCRAKKEGLTRHIGVSNYPTALLEQALSFASEPLVTNQCEYHPFIDQTKVRETCFKHGLSFTSYSPLGLGTVLNLPVILDIARDTQRTPAQVILRWHIQQPQTIVIPKSSSIERITENLNAFDFELSPDQMKKIFELRKPDGRITNPEFAPAWDN